MKADRWESHRFVWNMIQYSRFQMVDEMLQTELWENRERRSLFSRVPFESLHLHHALKRHFMIPLLFLRDKCNCFFCSILPKFTNLRFSELCFVFLSAAAFSGIWVLFWGGSYFGWIMQSETRDAFRTISSPRFYWVKRTLVRNGNGIFGLGSFFFPQVKTGNRMLLDSEKSAAWFS